MPLGICKDFSILPSFSSSLISLKSIKLHLFSLDNSSAFSGEIVVIYFNASETRV
jgi:hypothetical protein